MLKGRGRQTGSYAIRFGMVARAIESKLLAAAIKGQSAARPEQEIKSWLTKPAINYTPKCVQVKTDKQTLFV